MLRFRTFSQYLKGKYPFKVFKIALDAGFTCPNRDGVKGEGGCTYCLNKSFSPYAGEQITLKEQFNKSYNFYKSKDLNSKFIVYLQAYSNTYAPIKILKQIYDEAVSFPDVIGLSIATRPDCISDAVLDLLESYTNKVDLWLEIGCESTHNKTLQLINRCHTYEEFEDSVCKSSNRGFRIVAHTIFGLPGESEGDMLTSVKRLSLLPVDDIKIHHLYVSPYTEMEKEYQKGEIKLLSVNEWVELCSKIIEHLPPSVVIQRIVGELNGKYVIAPLWEKSKTEIIRLVNKKLEERDSHQGKLFENKLQVSA
ncbi:MAG: TIGR01212 family radical SAM protein [Planctomycetes bacterium]|nr:TIGR01212 family radical SAM protein [Planctomycetota bacterium]